MTDQDLLAAERERRRRSEALEKLLPTLAEALDVREVFPQLSAVAQELIPHDLLELGILNAERTHAQVYAASRRRCAARSPPTSSS